jgi:hypothetical protein
MEMTGQFSTRSYAPSPTYAYCPSCCLFPWASACCSLLAYCTARFGRSNFGHQMPPRLPTRFALQRRKLGLMDGEGPVNFA